MNEKDIANGLYVDGDQFRENLRLLLEHQEEMAKDIRCFMEKIEAYKAKPEAESEDEAKAPTTCRHNICRHPGCLNRDSSHAHGPWWPREKCSDENCRMRVPGWNLPNVRAAPR